MVAVVGRVGETFMDVSGSRVRVVGMGPVVRMGWDGVVVTSLW